jgi:hypothetical protein
MATIQEEEIEKELKIALIEIGAIKPWYDEEVSCWVFCHPLYPSVECGEDSPEEVLRVYPLYLREFISHRMINRIDPLAESKTKGRGGARPGAGRPKKPIKTINKSMRLPPNIANIAGWLRIHPEAIAEVQQIMRKYA